jgi:RNA polymerase sigma-70 factor, ECF subfamily
MASPMDAGEDDRLDRDLVEGAQRGDREAFAILARTHGDRLMQIAQRILRDVGRAEDAVQQTLVIAWRELPSLRDPDRFDAWLQRLLVNACYAEARRTRDWNANVRVLPIDGPAGPDETISLDNRDRIDRAFRRLPPDQRACSCSPTTWPSPRPRSPSVSVSRWARHVPDFITPTGRCARPSRPMSAPSRWPEGNPDDRPA